jgi:hypothetical protein
VGLSSFLLVSMVGAGGKGSQLFCLLISNGGFGLVQVGGALLYQIRLLKYKKSRGPGKFISQGLCFFPVYLVLLSVVFHRYLTTSHWHGRHIHAIHH